MLQANINKETLIFKIIKYFSFGITGVRFSLPLNIKLKFNYFRSSEVRHSETLK